MKAHGLCLFVILSAIPAAAAQPGDASRDFEKRIKALQDQIDELRSQRDAAIKEQEKEAQRQQQERRQKAEAESKKRYAKTELRGKLVKTMVGNAATWQIDVNGLKVSVEFLGKVNWHLEEHAGKEVIITGHVVGRPIPVVASDPTFPPPMNDIGFSPQASQAYNDSRTTYEDLVKTRNLLNELIKKTIANTPATLFPQPPYLPYGPAPVIREVTAPTSIVVIVGSLKSAEE